MVRSTRQQVVNLLPLRSKLSLGLKTSCQRLLFFPVGITGSENFHRTGDLARGLLYRHWPERDKPAINRPFIAEECVGRTSNDRTT